MENTLSESKIEELINTAKEYREKAYSPYSNLKVGAALLCSNGKIFGGCNVESVSFGLTICAERNAIFKAVSEGEKDYKAIALVIDDHHYGSPCGACRQVMREFGTDIIIIMATASGEYIIKGLEEVLPFSFGSELGGLIGAGAGRVGVAHDKKLKFSKEIASMIDHTLLKADATKEQIDTLCDEAKEYEFASVCVNPTWVKSCSSSLSNSKVMVCTVIGFPLGASTPKVKAAETREAIKDGADEIDMVINIGAIKAGDMKTIEDEIHGVVEAANGHTVKVILETGLLTDEMKIAVCELSKKAGAHFVKTSTGFAGSGATPEDIALMRKTVGPSMGVKASGGVRDLAQVKNLMKVGATRIGASASIAIVKGEKSNSDY